MKSRASILSGVLKAIFCIFCVFGNRGLSLTIQRGKSALCLKMRIPYVNTFESTDQFKLIECGEASCDRNITCGSDDVRQDM